MINSYGEVIGVTTGALSSGQNLNFAVPINSVMPDNGQDIKEFGNTHGMFTMAEYAEANAYVEYSKIPEAYDTFIMESESNNTNETANHIKNGATVYGSLNDGYCDNFKVYCNTVGAIDVFLYSDSLPRNVADIVLCIEPVNNPDKQYIYGDQLLMDHMSGTYHARYIIPRPGIYIISVLSYDLYKYENFATSYDFYYIFTPGDTSGANTTGSTRLACDPETYLGKFLEKYGYHEVLEGATQTIDSYSLGMTDTSGAYTYEIGYSPDTEVLIVSESYQGFTVKLYFTGAGTTKNSNKIMLNYYSNGRHQEGFGFINPSTFSQNTKLSFYAFTGNANLNKSACEDFCVAIAFDLLHAVDYMFDYYGIGLDISDFGFSIF